MSVLKADMTHLQSLIGDAFSKTGALVALADAGNPDPNKIQRTLETIADEFERATLELRRLCECSSPGTGGYMRRPWLASIQIAGSVEMLEYTWLHIQINTLLPHCRYQTPAWLTDTIRRLLDVYAASGRQLPFYKNRAALVIEEYSDIDNRKIFDQDNKGWKAVSNALKGRLFPDDDQYDLGLVLLSRRSSECVTHITVMDMEDLGQFLSSHVIGPIGRNGYFDV